MKSKKLFSIGMITTSVFLSTSLIASAATTLFKDTKTHWAKASIQWASEKKIVVGYPDGTFKPEKKVTEAEFISMLLRAYQPPSFFTKKVGQAHWADNEYEYSARMNYPVRELRNVPMTRQQVADFIVASQGLHYTGNNSIQYLLGRGLAKGKTTLSIEGYKGSDTLTRAEAVQFIKTIKEKGTSTLMPRPETPSNPSNLPKLPVTQPKPGSSIEDKVAKNPAILGNVGELIKFLESLNSFSPYKKTLVAGRYNDVDFGKHPVYGSAINMYYDEQYGKQVGIAFHQFTANEQKLLKEILKVFYPNSYEKAFAPALKVSKMTFVPDKSYIETKYDGRSFRAFKGNNPNGFGISIGVK
ncbi:S-layer homology domain-containing protein [Aneurinibacillus sp. REN35]|uniref:S-layer homology domain-containing protein n=1 Tax=Aneurinibacillus sp. REN35 TaxID=3237286 RepID=UPI003527A84D